MVFKKGRTAWNKGLNKEMQPFYNKHHSKNTKNKISKNIERNKKISLKLKQLYKKGNFKPKGFLGKNHTDEWKRQQSIKLKGKKFSQEHKNKLSEIKKKLIKEGKIKISCGFKKGHIPWNKELNKEINEKIREAGIKSSETKIKKGIHKGEKNHFYGLVKEKSANWKGGISFEPYGLDFNNQLKEYIRQRDNYRCQQCFRHQDELFRNTKAGIRKCKLHIHHIDFNKKNNNPDNLISLCLNCHMQTNYNREDWIDYFKEKTIAKL